MAKDNQEEVIVDVEQAYSKSEQWVIENQKSLSIIFSVVLLLAGSYFAYKNFYEMPQEEQAREMMWEAEKAFGQDSLDLALNGNIGGASGFLDIINDYGITQSANLAHYYAGISYLRMGDYENAIKYLEDFDCNDVMVCAVAKGATGDAYMELGQVDKAINFYKRAVEHNSNDLTAPFYLMKAAGAHEAAGDMNDALELYKEIKAKYPNSAEGSSIDKYISRTEGQIAG